MEGEGESGGSTVYFSMQAQGMHIICYFFLLLLLLLSLKCALYPDRLMKHVFLAIEEGCCA